MAATLVGVQPELRLRVEGVLREGGGELYLSEGFRTYAEQVVFWNKYLRGGSLAARPGTSEHEKGRACDIAIKTNRGWDLRNNLCARWGLLRDVPGEAWHHVLSPRRSSLPVSYPALPTKALPVPPKADVMTPETVVASLLTPSGGGTWCLQNDGGVITHGDAPFLGSYWSWPLAARLGNRGGFVDIQAIPGGYSILSADGSHYEHTPAVWAMLQAQGGK